LRIHSVLSSGKPERFLQLCDTQALEPAMNDTVDWQNLKSDVNLSVVNLTTPANYFHLLRRQQMRSFRKPVVVMSPKTILRLADATSSLVDMAEGTHFQPVLADPKFMLKSTDAVKRVLLCSGKIYYDLSKHREQLNREDIAIVRVEELSPFPFDQVAQQIENFSSASEVIWVQEEPANQGAWLYVRSHLEKCLSQNNPKLQFIGRQALPTSAVGLSKRNTSETKDILKKALEV